MPNGGSDFCGSCWANSAVLGASKADCDEEERHICTVRWIKIYSPFTTHCANHQHHHRSRLTHPIGAVYLADFDDPYTRRLLHEGPDNAKGRANRQAPVPYDKVAGCLIGQCVADALGFILEGSGTERCTIFAEYHLGRNLKIPLGRSPFPFGQYTDDSQLARELMLSFVARRGFVPADYAARISRLFQLDKVVGRGAATEASATRLAGGAEWQNSGTPPPSAGDGSAMRAAPIGLICSDDPRRLSMQAHVQSVITHLDPRCSAGAAAIAGAVGYVVRNPNLDLSKFVVHVAKHASEFHEGFGEILLQLTDWVLLPPDTVLRLVRDCTATGSPHSHWPGISPYVVPAVTWSLYSFLRTPESYVDTIRTAIACGGDVDTTAAMAGAISGAFLGLDAVPRVFASKLTDEGEWGYSALLDLAKEFTQILAQTSLPSPPSGLGDWADE